MSNTTIGQQSPIRVLHREGLTEDRTPFEMSSECSYTTLERAENLLNSVRHALQFVWIQLHPYSTIKTSSTMTHLASSRLSSSVVGQLRYRLVQYIVNNCWQTAMADDHHDCKPLIYKSPQTPFPVNLKLLKTNTLTNMKQRKENRQSL